MATADMDDNALEKVQSYQYPRAHYGHLISTQQSALDEFKSLSKAQGYYTPAGPGRKPSHDDETMLRYLRARKFVPKDAFAQFKDTEDWRKTNRIDDLYTSIDINDFEETRRLYPQWTGRRDKRGIPVYVFEVAYLNAKTMAAYDKSIAQKQQANKQPSTKLMRLFALYESLLRFVMPLCSIVPDRPFPETPVSQSNNIVDISRVGLKQFWNLKNHMQDASQLATAHYPETLDRIFIIGAPSFFPTVWSWIKRWFDPITVSKIFIVSPQDMKKTLEQYIEPRNIPTKYGGELDWAWGDMPSLEPEVQDVLRWKGGVMQKGAYTFPIGPIRWEQSANGKMTAIAVGSVDDSPRSTTVAHIAAPVKSLRLSIQTDPDLSLGGPLSTTGTHTHPEEGQGYFPASGNTPTDEHSENELYEQTKQMHGDIRVASAATSAALPDRTSELNPVHTTREEGTSDSLLEQQAKTLAKGEIVASTPDQASIGTGDKSSSHQASTAGQVPADIKISDTEPEEKKSSSLDQAKATVNSGSANATSLVGLGSRESQERAVTTTEAPEAKVEDARIDGLPKATLEDFMRRQAQHEGEQETVKAQ